MDKTHRWYPLVRGWERTLRVENKADSTVDIYLRGVRIMTDWLDQLPVEETEPGDVLRPEEPADITKSHIAEWMKHLLDTTTPGNANNKYRSVQQWFKRLPAEEEIPAHPMATLKPPFVPEKPVPLVPDDLVLTVLDQCKGRDFLSRRDTAIIRLIWDTGARLSEIATLTLDAVDLDLDVIQVFGKGRRIRSIPFSPKTGQALSRYLRARADNRYAHHDRFWLSEKGKGPLTKNGIKLMLRRRGKQAGVNDAMG